SSEREKISFNQLNKKTGNRIRYRKVDAETEEEVESSDIIKGYEVGKGQHIEIETEELEAIAIESKRTIEIDEFVPKKEIDELYLICRPGAAIAAGQKLDGGSCNYPPTNCLPAAKGCMKSSTKALGYFPQRRPAGGGLQPSWQRPPPPL